MYNTLEDLWMGNIQPATRPLTKEIEDLYNAVAPIRNELFDKLSPEHQKMLNTMLELSSSLHHALERDSFIVGFRLATRLMTESMCTPER